MPQRVLEGFLPQQESDPPQEIRTARLTMLLPPTVKRQIASTCRQHRVSMNDVLIRLLEYGFEHDLFPSLVEASIKYRRSRPAPGRPSREEETRAA